MTDDTRIKDALATLLADHGREPVLALAVACARSVLPLLTLAGMADTRLWRALGPDRRPEDLRACEAAMYGSWFSDLDHQPTHAAATALSLAARLLFSAQDLCDADVLVTATQCAQLTAEAVRRTLDAGSAQERLECVVQMDGHIAFADLLVAGLATDFCWQPGRLFPTTGPSGRVP